VRGRRRFRGQDRNEGGLLPVVVGPPCRGRGRHICHACRGAQPRALWGAQLAHGLALRSRSGDCRRRVPRRDRPRARGLRRFRLARAHGGDDGAGSGGGDRHCVGRRNVEGTPAWAGVGPLPERRRGGAGADAYPRAARRHGSASGMVRQRRARLGRAELLGRDPVDGPPVLAERDVDRAALRALAAGRLDAVGPSPPHTFEERPARGRLVSARASREVQPADPVVDT